MERTTQTRQKLCKANLVCLTITINCVFTISPTQAESLEDLGAIIQTQQTRSFSDIDLFTTTVDTSPTVVSNLEEGGTPAVFIKQKYGFGASDSKAAYDVLEKRILDLNGAADPTRLRKGKIVVPDLPILTSATPPQPPNPVDMPTFSNGSGFTNVFGSFPLPKPQIVYTQAIKIPPPISESLNYFRIDKYPAMKAQNIFDQITKKGLIARIGSEAGIKITATSSDCSATTTNILSQNEKQTIETVLAAPKSNIEHYLIILDTGWPTYDQQLSSMRNIRRIFDTARVSLRISENAIPRFDPELKAALYKPPTHNHACMIYNSLREFTSLDKSERLKIVYLPLRPGQPMAADYFRELIEITQLMESLGADASSRTPKPEEIDNARAFASSALKDLIALNTPWLAGDDVVRIYEPLVRGLVAVLDRYAKPDPSTTPAKPNVDARFIISLSWNFTKFVYPPSLPSSRNYLVFAAAGNDNTDFVAANRLFASEAAGGNKVVAVMNSDEKSGRITCNSAFFVKLWDDDNSSTNIASFPGRLGDAGTTCPGPGGGTSFSTPRLAWLSAISSISSGIETDNWSKVLVKRLLKSRVKVEADRNAAPVDIKTLLSTK